MDFTLTLFRENELVSADGYIGQSCLRESRGVGRNGCDLEYLGQVFLTDAYVFSLRNKLYATTGILAGREVDGLVLHKSEPVRVLLCRTIQADMKFSGSSLDDICADLMGDVRTHYS